MTRVAKPGCKLVRIRVDFDPQTYWIGNGGSLFKSLEFAADIPTGEAYRLESTLLCLSPNIYVKCFDGYAVRPYGNKGGAS